MRHVVAPDLVGRVGEARWELFGNRAKQERGRVDCAARKNDDVGSEHQQLTVTLNDDFRYLAASSVRVQ
jgi:hypothetical protein